MPRRYGSAEYLSANFWLGGLKSLLSHYELHQYLLVYSVLTNQMSRPL